MGAVQQLSENLFRFTDTCHVYVVRNGSEAVLVDFGAGDVLEALLAIGVRRVTDVLVTHHHRTQVQGLARAVAAGAAIWVPHAEQDLVARVDEHWQARELFNNYNMRQDRFSLLSSVPITGTLHDYAAQDFGGRVFTVVPTPGHTTGAVTLMAEVDGHRVAFVGDLLAAPGKLWTLAGTTWSYNGAEGLPATVLSLLDLRDRGPDVLYPSHGEPIEDVFFAVDLTVARLVELMRARGQNPRLATLLAEPYVRISPHLLRNRTSVANSYVLLSESGKAAFIDFGYDFTTGIAAGSDRASRRPWLYTLPALKRDFGVSRVDVAIPTHFHDDHVAGLPLLREVEGTQVWAAANFADVLEQPATYDLPCLWYDPIPVDRRLPLNTPFRWEEYTLAVYALHGHTRYAVAIACEVDGARVLATGDQYQGGAGLDYNYVYRSGFDADDYADSAALYRRLNPDLILPGHWEPLRVTPEYLDQLAERGDLIARLHRSLLPVEPDLTHDDSLARLYPYQAETRGDVAVEYTVEVHNPFARAERAQVCLVAPSGWQVTDTQGGPAPPCPYTLAGEYSAGTLTVELAAHADAQVSFCVTPPAGLQVRRVRLAADVTIGTQRFGQQAEALLTVV